LNLKERDQQIFTLLIYKAADANAEAAGTSSCRSDVKTR